MGMISKQSSPTWFIVAFCIARITMGAFVSITGPTLPILAHNMNVSLPEVNWAITVRSIAIMMGSLVPDLIFGKIPPLLCLAIAMAINGIAQAMIPYFTVLYLFHLCIAFTGFTFGVADMGIQSLILKYWGNQGSSRSLIQLFHGMFAIGAFLSPQLCQVFIGEMEVAETLPSSCNITQLDSSTIAANESEPVHDSENQNKLIAPYFICGVAVVLTACLYLFLHSQKLLDQLDDENKEMAEPRPEESLDTLLGIFFVSVFLFYFGLQSVEVVFNQQIYTYARCTGSTRPEATQLNQWYWAAFGASRFIAVFVAKGLKPILYLAGCIIIGFVGTCILFTPYLTISVVMIAFTIAIYYPSGVSFSSQWTNMSGKYIGVFAVGCTSGAMIPPLINMYLMEIDFTYFIGTVLISQLICIASFFGIWRIGEKLKSRSHSEKTNDTLLCEKY